MPAANIDGANAGHAIEHGRVDLALELDVEAPDRRALELVDTFHHDELPVTEDADPFVEEVVMSDRFADRGFVDVDRARKAFERHKRGDIDINADIWKWTNVEIWMRRFIDDATPAA